MWCGSRSERPCESLVNKTLTRSVISYTPGTYLTNVSTAKQPVSYDMPLRQSTLPSTTTVNTLLANASQSSLLNNHPADNHLADNRRLVATGISLGAPLMILAIGLLGFIFWKTIRKQTKPDGKAKTKNNDTDQGITAQSQVGPSHSIELMDSQRPWELDHRAVRVELAHGPQ